jgi:A/G-specific adenine glycosylase
MFQSITVELLNWFSNNKRDLPWRKTKDPYRIWLSEIIFQQTRINQGMTYYNKFITCFPDIHSFASATEDELLKLWQGLGYYSRARNMLKTAQLIVDEFKGVFPMDYSKLLALKGIGEYTASVIMSVCFDKPYPVIDGNVNRLISRLFNIQEFVDKPAGKKLILSRVSELIDKNQPGDFNEAMMDFGALICTPQNPGCTSCNLQKYCLSYKKGNVEKLPLKSPKRKSKHRNLNYVLIHSNEEILIQQRKAKDIWQHLYELPLIELEPNQELNHKQLERNLGCKVNDLNLIFKVNHKLTHQDLAISFYKVDLENLPEGFITVKTWDLANYAFPKPLKKFLSDLNS